MLLPIDDILEKLDEDRRRVAERTANGDVFREHGCVTYSRCKAEDIDEAIAGEIALAKERGYTLEWKTYGYDGPHNLKERLLAAGFTAEPVEKFLVLPVSEETLAAFGAPAHDIQRIYDPARLCDVAEVLRSAGHTDVEQEINRFAVMLQQTPAQMSVYVAYVAGEPAAYARAYFVPGSEFSGFYGGNTKPKHRNKGLYTALVAARLKEAFERKCKYASVDALPTSEPILRKRGFQFVTTTQPFIYKP